MRGTRVAAAVCVALAATAAFAVFGQAGDSALGVVALDADGRLALPVGTDRWIAVGTGIGGEYSDLPFDPANPGRIGVVQMEPKAYDYFLANGRYANGTMFLLTFYATQAKPDPALPGFVQGDVAAREIHLIDNARFPQEGGAFFLFPVGINQPAKPMPLGSECAQCHAEHGAFEGTFVQFYPPLRAIVAPR